MEGLKDNPARPAPYVTGRTTLLFLLSCFPMNFHCLQGAAPQISGSKRDFTLDVTLLVRSTLHIGSLKMAEVTEEKAPSSTNAGTRTGTTSEVTTQPDSTGIVVGFDGEHDPCNPLNWSMSKKIYTSLLYSLTSFGSVWASTAYVNFLFSITVVYTCVRS